MFSGTKKFKYLGSVLTEKNEIEKDIKGHLPAIDLSIVWQNC